MPTKKNTTSKTNDKVVSAFIFDKQQAGAPASRKNKNEQTSQPITASVFVDEESDLTFKIRLRNILQFVFDCLRENLIDLAPVTAIIRRSLDEIKALGPEVDRRMNAETSKRYHDLIEEITFFLKGEATSTATDDMKAVMHYRHYVRIAWFSHFILEDLNKFGR
jgi:hypothetical protein